MGSQASKPITPTTTSREITNEKQSLALGTATANKFAALSLEDMSTTVEAGLTPSIIADWQTAFSNSPTLKLSQLLLNNTDPLRPLVKRDALMKDQFIFNLELKGVKSKDGNKGAYPGPITNQKSSGRCWLFSSHNVLRYAITNKLNLGDFQLSQAYPYHMDQLEKSNYFLENMLDLVDEPLDSRIVSTLMQEPVSDGGQYDMVINLLEKYGCVPQVCYPESWSSSNTGKVDKLVIARLREGALELRALSKDLKTKGFTNDQVLNGARKRKEEIMQDIYNILNICLGTPPKPDEEFDWEYTDRDGKARKMSITPLDFYKKFTGPYLAKDNFSLIHDPRSSPDILMTVDKLGNVKGGLSINYVNAEITALEDAVITSIKADQPVFFGCDVGQQLIGEAGVMDVEAWDYESCFGVKLGMNKQQRLETGASQMTHAMVITAVHLDDAGRPLRYKIENSWGEAAGDKGFYLMTSAWFKEYVYQVVVPKALAKKKYVDILEGGDAVVLPRWDPLGSLA